MASPIPKKDESGPSRGIYREALEAFKNHDLPSAIQKLESLLQSDPSFEDAYEALAICLSKAGQLEKAIETTKKWIRLFPLSKMSHVNLSRFYMEKGLIAEAEHEQAEARRLSWIEELKQKKMKMPAANPEEKIERFKKVIDLDPKDVLGYYSLGEAYFENQRYQEAIEIFSKGLEVDPGHSSSYLGLGQSYQAVGDKQKAEEVFRKGIKISEARGDVMPQKKMEARLRQLSSETSS